MLERKIRIIESFLGGYYKSRNEFLFHCPKCKHHKPKLSINFDKDVFKCWICDYNGRTISRLVYYYGKKEHKESWNAELGIVDQSQLDKPVEEEIVIALPKEFISLTGNKITPLSLSARKYLNARGLATYDIIWWKIGYCPDGQYKNRIIIPSFDLEGNINYFIARNYKDKWNKYLNPSVKKDFIFNELYLDWDKDITIVEGVFDAIVARNSIPLLGSTLREDSYIFQRIVEKCSKVFIALDHDARAKEDKIIKLLLSYGVEVYRIDTSGFDDVGEMRRTEFEIRKESSSFVSFDNYLLEKLLA